MSDVAKQTLGVSKLVPQGSRIFVIPSLVRYQFGRAIDILSLLFRSQKVDSELPIAAMHALMRIEALSVLDRDASGDSWIRMELAWGDDVVGCSIIIDADASTIDSIYKTLETKPKEILEATRYLTQLLIQRSGVGNRATLEMSALVSRKENLSTALGRGGDATKLKIEMIAEQELETVSPRHEYQSLPSIENLIPKEEASTAKQPSMADALMAAVKIRADKQEEEQVTIVSGSYEEENEETIRISGSKTKEEPEKVVRFKAAPKKKKEKSVTVIGAQEPIAATNDQSGGLESLIERSQDDWIEEGDPDEAVMVISGGPSVAELKHSVQSVRRSKASSKKAVQSSVPAPTHNAEEIIDFFKGLLSQDEAIAALEMWFNERIARAIVKKTVSNDQIEQLLSRVTKNSELTKQLLEIMGALPADEPSAVNVEASVEADGSTRSGTKQNTNDSNVFQLEKELAEKEKSVEFYQRKMKELEERLSEKAAASPEDSYFKKRMQELEAELSQAKIAQRERDAAMRKRELDLQQAESRLVRKLEEAEHRAKMAERLTASSAEMAAQAAKAEAEAEGSQNKFDQDIDRVQASMQEARNQLADEKAKAIIDAAMSELNVQKAELKERSRAMANEMKKQEFQFSSKVTLIQEELRQVKLVSEQKDTQIARMKELMARVQEKYEAERASVIRLNNEAMQMKTAAEQFRRQFEESQKEIERQKKRVDTEASEKQSNAGGGQVGQLNKQLAEVNKNLLAKKQEVEQLKRQLNEKTAVEAELKKQLTRLQAQQGDPGAKKPKAG